MLPFYPFYWGDYSAKTFDLSQGEHGAYMLFLRHIYTEHTPIPHEQRWSIAKAMLEQERSNADAVLLKYFQRKGDNWHNRKAEGVIEEAAITHQRRVNAGKKPKKQCLSNAEAMLKQPEPEPEPERKIKIEGFALLSDGDEKTLFADCVKAWNEMASEFKIPQVQALTETRKTALRLRLKEIGGFDGWQAMCEKIRAGPHLHGVNDRGWTVFFDWVLKPANLTKIMEGNYDEKGHGNGKVTTGHKPGSIDESWAIVDAVIDEKIRRERSAGSGSSEENAEGIPGLRAGGPPIPDRHH